MTREEAIALASRIARDLDRIGGPSAVMLADVDAAGMVDHLDLYDGQTLAHVGRIYAPWHWEQLVEQARAIVAATMARA